MNITHMRYWLKAMFIFHTAVNTGSNYLMVLVGRTVLARLVRTCNTTVYASSCQSYVLKISYCGERLSLDEKMRLALRQQPQAFGQERSNNNFPWGL
eukprot:6211357-Pleurochrysis_carterae.AAC.2